MGNKKKFEYWVSQFNSLRHTVTIDKYSYGDYVEFMDLFIFKGDDFTASGKFDVTIFQTKKTSTCMSQLKVDMLNIPLLTSSLEN